jgi:integrase
VIDPYAPELLPAPRAQLALFPGAAAAPCSIPTHLIETDALAAATAEAMRLRDDDLSETTREHYVSDWRHFVRWVARAYPDRQISAPVDPALIGLYIGALRLRGLAKSTISHHLLAIQYAHRLWGVESPLLDPDLRQLRRGLARQIERPRRATNALVIEEATAMLTAIGTPRSLADVRDRAIFTLAWCSALRSANVVALDVDDVHIVELDGQRVLEVLVRRCKVDRESGNHRLLFDPEQLGRETIGRRMYLPALPGEHPMCAVRAVGAWLERSALTSGPLFPSLKSDRSIGESRIGKKAVANVVKRIVSAAGGDPRAYAAHSLRRGFVTSADAAGVRKALIRNHGGWKDDRSVSVYTRIQDNVRENALRAMFSPRIVSSLFDIR